MTLSPGTRLGPYEVLSLLGAGGMGEVWRARDTRLDRPVAIKVVKDGALGPENRLRFEREARAVAKLSHPHVCALFDVGREGGVDYLVMELLEGETLAARLARGRLPIDEVLRFGGQISAALAAAHRQGIVHRDLKPGNVLLTKGGCKLLDFGLARALSSPTGAEAAEAVTGAPSLAGDRFAGTLPYMAPEQIEGKAADARTDVFALGAVLYEMATGARPFPSGSSAALAGEILRAEPPSISSLVPLSPRHLDRVVKGCLVKDPDERWQSAADVGRELGWMAEEAVAVPASGATRRSRTRAVWAAAALATVLFASLAAGFALFPRPAVPEEPTRFKILPSAGQNLLGFASLSPDGRRILTVLRDDGGRNRLAVRSLDSLDFRILPGTDDVRGGFWSPDSREVAFFSNGSLQRTSADGGPVTTVSESGGAVWGAWSPSGTILFAKQWAGSLYSVPASGGTPRPATSPDPAEDDVYQHHPSFLPDGRHFLYLASNSDFTKSRIRLGSLDGGETRALFPSDTGAVYAEPGYLLFARTDAVLAWRFDPKELRLVGEPVPAFTGVQWMPGDAFLSLSASRGRVAYISWSGRRRLVWVDRKGRELGTLGEEGAYADVRISPGGDRVAVTLRDVAHRRTGDIWIVDAARGTRARLTPEPTDEFDPAWSPDGRSVAYVSDGGGVSYDILERPADGGPERPLLRTEKDKISPAFLAGGRRLLVSEAVDGRYVRRVFSLDGPARPSTLGVGSALSEEHPSVSPDGRWSAFDAVEAGQREVYLQAVPDGPRRQLSIGGGQMPVWSRGGRELLYAARDGTLMSVALRSAGGRLEAGEPQPLFPLRFDMGGELPWHRQPYDVTPDGERFLVIRRAPGVEADGIVVVSGWTSVLAGR